MLKGEIILMEKTKNTSHSIKRITFITIVISLFFGVGVIAGNLKTINNIKIAFSNNHEMNVVTTKNTVEEVLKENHIELLEDEIVLPSLETNLKENTTIKILKKSEMNTIAALAAKGENIPLEELLNEYTPITEKIVVEKQEIPYETITKDSTNGKTDTTSKVIQEGKDGIQEITYKIKYQNEIEIEREVISSKIIKEPINKIVQVQGKASVTSRGEERSDTPKVTPTGGLSDKVVGITPTVVTLNTSAYCSCSKCCGKSNGVTASGERASAWYTVAAGSKYPIGTIIYIPALSGKANGGWFVVQDRGGAISSNKLDVFVGSHSEALQFGRKNLECYIYM